MGSIKSGALPQREIGILKSEGAAATRNGHFKKRDAAATIDGHYKKRGRCRNEKWAVRSEEHTSELQSHSDIVCRLLLEKKKIKNTLSRYVTYCEITTSIILEHLSRLT